MTDLSADQLRPQPPDSMVTLTHVLYGLHAMTVVTGLMTSAFIVTLFLTGWPSIIAVFINYFRRDEVRGTFLESHFAWQRRTFWFALLWVAVATLLFLTVVGIPLAFVIAAGAGLWVLYRIARGWMRLLDRLVI